MCTFINYLNAQVLSTENGYAVPVKTTAAHPIRILFVFGEVDAANNGSTCWPDGQIATEAPNWIDPTFSTNPAGYITKYYYDASFGEYVVIGDYLDQVLDVNSYSDVASMFSQLNAIYTANGNSLPLHHGSVLSDTQNDFDHYWLSQGVQGNLKTPTSDGGIDVLIFCVRSSGGTGNGCRFWNSSLAWHMIGPHKVNTLGNFYNTGDLYGASFVIEEYMHNIFGGNEWHLGRSAGEHTFASPVNPWGLTAQTSSGTLSNVVSGWDRKHLGWKHPANSMLTSTRDGVTGNEVDGQLDLINNPASSTDGTYILRDFVTTGDALQIKLPHLNFQTSGDKKNQYIWLENHQQLNSFDHDWNYNFYNLRCSGVVNCGTNWNVGILSQLQVGKDQKTDNQWPYPLWDYASGGSQPNATASWLFPLIGTGNYDYAFTPPQTNGAPCSFLVPLYDISNPLTKPNPFTGYNYAFGIPNSYPDNMIWPPSPQNIWDIGAGPGIFESGNIYWRWNSTGGDKTAFSCNGPCPSLGKKILGLTTNPAPVPVYTYESNGYKPINQLGTWENRQIWLNGLSITILEENYQSGIYGPGAVKIKVRWDDYDVENDVRWCGNILLSPNDLNATNPSIHLINNSTLLLDRGMSPTRMDAVVQINGEWVFSEPTVFSCLPQSFVSIETGSKIIVDNGSTLILQNQSKIILQPNAQIIVRNNSKLILESGCFLQLNGGAKVIIEDGSTLEYYPNAEIQLNGVYSSLEIAGLLDLKDYSDFTFTYNTNLHGFVLFNSPQPLPLNIHAGLNCTITLSGSSQYRKVLEVAQEGFYPPSNLIAFSVQQGSVELHAVTRILPLGWQTFVNFDNVKLTSDNHIYNGHLGLQMVGQYHSITNSIFENGKFGIHYIATLGHNDFFASDCTFRNCQEGLFTSDKGAHLTRCHFTGNSVLGWNTGIMSSPSEAIEGDVGGTIAGSNYQGLYYYANNMAPLTIENPNITYNNTSGVQVERTLVKPSCGTISYNLNEGIILGKAATLQMDNGANVTCVGNAFTIALAHANYLFLYKGNNDLTPLQPQSYTAVAGTLISPGPYPIIADQNRWNGVPNLTPLDYGILYNGVSVTMTDANSQNIIPPCGQANPVPPPAPGGPNDPLSNCEECDVINTEDFSNEKLNEATLTAIEKAGDNTAGNYIEAVNLFSQILMEDYANPNNKEKYLLSLNYLKMLDALGNAFGTGQLTWQQNISSIDVTTQKVIEVLNKLIDVATDSNNYSARLIYNFDKAAVLRLADRRELGLDVLYSVSNWIVQDDADELSRIVCIYDLENQALLGSLPPEATYSALNNCGVSQVERMGHFMNSNTASKVEELRVDIYPNPATTEITIITNVQHGESLLTNSIGQKVYNGSFSNENIIDVGSFPKGIYSLEITDKESGRKKIQKVVIQ